MGILAIRLAPGMTFAIPYFVLLQYFGLLDTHLGLIIIYFVFNLAMIVWSLASFFEDIPYELEEAAFVDGATQLQTFSRIVLPVITPGLAATAILAFILSWNEFMFALLMTRRFAKTAPVAIMNFAAYEGISWGQMTAGAMLFTLPVLVFAFVVRKYLVAGLTGGAVKG
jgi:multiple sugar transport system permease protein